METSMWGRSRQVDPTAWACTSGRTGVATKVRNITRGGQFSNGVRHGFGSWASSNGKSYRGTYQNDRRCGFGVFVWPSGAVYEGNFFDDLRQGFGTLTWPQGTTYKGCWNQGRRHGQGVVIESIRLHMTARGRIDHQRRLL
jgi:hypothetical protein